MATSNKVTISLISRKEEVDDLSKLALATGCERHEIIEMMSKDRVFIAKRRGKTIGFIALKTVEEGNTIEISGLAIRQRERRKGVARLLVKHAERLTRSWNVESLIVRTSNDNIPALALYQQNGFRISGVRLGVLAEHHGGREVVGWQGIPVRDEITLEKAL